MDFRDPGSIAAEVGYQGASVIQVESSKLIGLLVVVVVLAIALASIALGLSIGARDVSNKAERESRLQRLEVDELKVALQTQGIKIHEGSTP